MSTSLPKCGVLPVGQHELDDEQLRARLHRLAAVAEDGQALVLVPVVDDVRQDVGVRRPPARSRRSCRTRWRRGCRRRARARSAGASRTTCGRSNSTPRGCGWRARMCASMLPVAPPTSTIDAETREVVGLGNRGGSAPWMPTIASLNCAASCGLLRQIVEDRHARSLLHRGLAGLDRVLETLPRRATSTARPSSGSSLAPNRERRVLSASPSGVSANCRRRPPTGCRSSRACASGDGATGRGFRVGPASSAAVLGPEARWSARLELRRDVNDPGDPLARAHLDQLGVGRHTGNVFGHRVGLVSVGCVFDGRRQ